METVGKGEIDFAALGVDPDAEVTLKRKPSLYGTSEQPSEGIGELIERLMIANMKLWAVCDKKANAANMSQEDLRVLVADDLNLCKSRAAIRAEINRRLGSVSGETVKHYGQMLKDAAKGWEGILDKDGNPPINVPEILGG